MSQPVKLYVIRHPNTFEASDTPVMVGSQSDLPLTKRGLEQAQALAHYFKDREILVDAIYSGSLSRQTKTADTIIKSYPQTPYNKEKTFDEINYGPWEKQTPEHINQRWPESYKAWTQQGIWPKEIFEESYEERITLLKSWLSKVSSLHQNQTVLAITSQGLIKLLLTLYPSLWHKDHSSSLVPFKVKTGHFCELELYGDDLKIKSWNQEPVALSQALV